MEGCAPAGLPSCAPAGHAAQHQSGARLCVSGAGPAAAQPAAASELQAWMCHGDSPPARCTGSGGSAQLRPDPKAAHTCEAVQHPGKQAADVMLRGWMQMHRLIQAGTKLWPSGAGRFTDTLQRQQLASHACATQLSSRATHCCGS
jgi:hypothetical protein